MWKFCENPDTSHCCSQMIEKALDKSGNNVDSAIRSLLNLHLESVQNNSGVAFEPIQETTEVQVSAEGNFQLGTLIICGILNINYLLYGSVWH